MLSAVTRWYFKGLIHCDKLLNYVIFCLFHLFWFVISFGFDILICWRKNLNNVFLYIDLHILWFWKTALECCILHYWHKHLKNKTLGERKLEVDKFFLKGWMRRNNNTTIVWLFSFRKILGAMRVSCFTIWSIVQCWWYLFRWYLKFPLLILLLQDWPIPC